MDKKEIYEHLAKIYLDASAKRKSKKKKYPRFFKAPIIVIVAFILTFSFFTLNAFHKNKFSKSEFALVLQNNVAKINFNFNPAKKEIYAINLNNLSLARFKALAFSARKESYAGNVSLRVEFTNNFKEKSEVYLKDISHKWQDYKIKLTDFKNISRWSQMSSLSFIVEEWNTKNKNAVVYVDDVRFLR